MTDISDEELDRLERLIPEYASIAGRRAFLDALARRQTILIVKDGWLVRINTDGSETRLEPSAPKHKVTAGQLFKLRPT
ncbi:hypothetical protein PS273GM_11775 [Stutzerimonas stutzeri]|uniref:Uncharacterized protein n=1 Tax=Stutzerimonas stutzeri TaxID=316 RepID=A0A172WQZ6_STUST|nr:hypothetical protein PS273GM_11775 [Stutzerimonas stutzeri]